MIVDVDRALERFLLAETGYGERVEVSFDAPSRDAAARLSRPTINLYLYDLREDPSLRDGTWEPRRQSHDRSVRRRRPRRIDLTYALTCWTSETDDAHRLIWSCLYALLRNPELPGEHVGRELASLPHPLRLAVDMPAPQDRSTSSFWTAMDAPLRPTLHLRVTVDLDLQREHSVPLVFSAAVSVPQMDSARAVRVGGVVLGGDGVAVEGAAVRVSAVAGDGQVRLLGESVSTDDQGRFILRNLVPGAYRIDAAHGGSASDSALVVGHDGQTSPSKLHLHLQPA